MISTIFSFEIIRVVKPGLNIFLQITASVADAAAFNPNGIKMLLANGLSTFPIKGSPFLVMALNVYLKILLILLLFSINLYQPKNLMEKL